MACVRYPELGYVPIFLDDEGDLFEFLGNTSQYKIILNNGYLAKTLTEKYNESILYGKIFYFHRWLMSKELSEAKKQNSLVEWQVHHKDQNKLNNKKENLEILDSHQHYTHHKKEKRLRAYKTWSKKVYGDYDDGDHWDEFLNWLDEKAEESFYD